MIDMKTICPMCFKIFDVSEELDKVMCGSCGHEYVLPKLGQEEKKN